MSVRALWIVSHDKGENGTVRFSRRFPTVEHRAKVLAASSYVPVPDDDIVLQLLLTELGLSEPQKPFVLLRDDCLNCQRLPALDLHIDGPGNGTLWPVLTVSHSSLILACLSLVDAPAEPRPPLSSLLSVSQGLALLSGLQNFLLSSGGRPDPDTLSSRFATLPALMLQVCPLGTPLDMPTLGPAPPPSTTQLPAANQKQPAWKTGLHRGRAVVTVVLVETVRSMQYGSQNRPDLWDVYGTVTCKCEVEGVLPNVTVTLTLPANGSPLQDVLVHPCVSSLDSSVLTASSVDHSDSSAFSGPYKFPFSPPLDSFRLCSYTSQVPVPPILGSYLLRKEEKQQLRVSVSLKLHESVKNSLDFCEAQLPFFNRDQMSSVELKVSSGQLDVSREKNLLIWVLGQKFPKSREATMEGWIRFCGPAAGPSDPLCTGLTSYIKLSFKISDATLSGVCVDQHSVQVYSSAKPRIFTSRELQSKDFFIWNSSGSAPASSGHLIL